MEVLTAEQHDKITEEITRTEQQLDALKEYEKELCSKLEELQKQKLKEDFERVLEVYDKMMGDREPQVQNREEEK